MSKDFHLFAKAVEARFAFLQKEHAELYVVDASDIFSLYIAAFPEGSNPIFRERTEHDCACCKSFVRHLGHVVAIDPSGRLLTVWDYMESLPEPYATVAAEMVAYVTSLPIRDVFRTKEGKFGAEQTHELLEDKTTRTWNHFWGKVDRKFMNASPEAVRGAIKTNTGVFKRSLEEISASAIDTVLDLIETNSIYRGAEFKSAVLGFKALHTQYRDESVARISGTFIWKNINNTLGLIRNTVIGTLLTDLSEGVDLDKAVRSFEQKVAPLNYKRPTSLISPKMIEQSLEKLKELGLESAVERRHATLGDVSVNNVLWVNNDARGKMKDGLAGLLLGSVKPVAVDLKGALDISAEAFFKDVVPQATSIDVLVENRHLGHFMSVTAPVDPDAGNLFKWDNNFAWSYDGDATDSIKSRVKKAGGNIEALLRVSLAWFNKDDLDLYCTTPRGDRISFINKAGILDVDMNAFSNIVRDPVENLAFNRIDDGEYRVQVNSYNRRETVDVGFTLEVEFAGAVQQFTYAKAVANHQTVDALVLTVKGGVLIKVTAGSGLVAGSASNEKWGITTETLVPVETLMASPNHWDDQAIGNKHWFFILKGALNPDPVRGIYNEFLKGELEPHRKVFEVLGAKTKAEFSPSQLSGLGFSSTRGDLVRVVVKGDKINRAYAITF